MKGNLGSEVLLRVETLSVDNFATTDSLRALAFAWSARRIWPTALCRIRTWGITKDEQGCHHLPPTPQPERRKCIHPSLYTQALDLRIQKLPQSPWVADPTDRQVKDLGTPDGTMNYHLNLTLISII